MSHVLMCVLSHHLIVLAKKYEVTAKQLSLLKKTNKHGIVRQELHML